MSVWVCDIITKYEPRSAGGTIRIFGAYQKLSDCNKYNNGVCMSRCCSSKNSLCDAVEYEPLLRGKWIDIENLPHQKSCSVCKKMTTNKPHRCPSCGALMSKSK